MNQQNFSLLKVQFIIIVIIIILRTSVQEPESAGGGSVALAGTVHVAAACAPTIARPAEPHTFSAAARTPSRAQINKVFLILIQILIDPWVFTLTLAGEIWNKKTAVN